jgi:hypothetical protein
VFGLGRQECARFPRGIETLVFLIDEALFPDEIGIAGITGHRREESASLTFGAEKGARRSGEGVIPHPLDVVVDLQNLIRPCPLGAGIEVSDSGAGRFQGGFEGRTVIRLCRVLNAAQECGGIARSGGGPFHGPWHLRRPGRLDRQARGCRCQSRRAIGGLRGRARRRT